MSKYKEIKKKIDELTKKAPHEIEYVHSQSVLKWVLKLKPNTDVALKIAALGHDIDRSVSGRIKAGDFGSYEEYKKQHALRSAKIISELMGKLNFDKKTLEKTRFLIENHEVGGGGDVEILKEADSLSFFENNLKHYKKINPDYVKDKIRFMYDRLSKKARKMVLEIKFQNEELKNLVMETTSEEEI